MSLTKVDIVTQEQAQNSFLIIGIQIGIFGYVLRLGLYKQFDNTIQTIKAVALDKKIVTKLNA